MHKQVFFSLVSLLFFIFSINVKASSPSIQILLLNSLDQDMPWQKSVELGLRDTLKKQNHHFDIYIENIDAGRFNEKNQLDLMAYYLANKYIDKRIDIIVTQDATAARLLEDTPSLFNNTPRIYVEPGQNKIEKDSQYKRFIHAQVEFKKANLAAINLTKPKKIVTINDSKHSISNLQFDLLNAILETSSPETELVHWLDLPLETLITKIQQEPTSTIVLYTPIFRQRNGEPLSPYQLAQLLTNKSKAPIFSYWHSLLGSGIIGGYLLSGNQIGQQTALAIDSLINNNGLVTINNEDFSGYYYDWRQLKKHQLLNKKLPSDATIEYYQPSYFEQHKIIILSTISIIIILTALLIFVSNINNRRLALVKELNNERLSLESKVNMRTKDLKVAKEVAEASAKAKAYFLANMSHEIRTPMNGVVGITNILKNTVLSEQQQQYLDKISYSANQLLVVINDILDFSKIDSGNIQLEELPFSINTVIDYIEATFQPLAEEKGIDFNIVLKSNVHPDLMGDVVRINQILINLCSNAIKFTSQGHVSVRIKEVPTTNKDKNNKLKLNILVEDTGIGIAPEKQLTLYDAFTQADTSTTRQYGGTGLGLTISKRLCELMQGDISIDSEVGKGTRFTAELCLKLNDQVVINDLSHCKETFTEPCNILVVDDNPLALTALKAQLNQLNLSTSLANSADQALQIITKSSKPFSAIVLDWTMPIMDGQGFILALQKLKPDYQANIIILTAYNTDIVKRHTKRLNISAVLQKPVLTSVLAATLQQSKQVKPENLSTHIDTVFDLDNISILVAEDNEINQIVIAETLKKEGAIITLTNDGLHCCETLASTHFDIILMDIHMPNMDGIEATQHIRKMQEESKSKIPIIALTANVMEDDVKHYLASGINAHVAKPIDINELKLAIFSLLEN